MKKSKKVTIVFTGGGTGGHIFPGLAVAKSLRNLAKEQGFQLRLVWIGNGSSKVMDRSIVTTSAVIDKFFGIPSGKLRRYASLKNFFDLFKVVAGFFASFFILLKLRPALIFSKGGYVSVPPCIAGSFLGVKVFTHECDYTPGLATKINSKVAKGIFLTYEETKAFFPPAKQSHLTVTGNPIREEFYSASAKRGQEFLRLAETHKKPILLVLGGSLGALALNTLVRSELKWLTDHFIVIHQTGVADADKNDKRTCGGAGEKSSTSCIMDSNENGDGSGAGELATTDYHPYAFIKTQMPDVLAAADIVMSRAGASTIWESAALKKPMLLIPLCGSGTRGDQVLNAEYFCRVGCALTLNGEEVTAPNMKAALEKLLDKTVANKMVENLKLLVGEKKPCDTIATILLDTLAKSADK